MLLVVERRIRLGRVLLALFTLVAVSGCNSRNIGGNDGVATNLDQEAGSFGSSEPVSLRKQGRLFTTLEARPEESQQNNAIEQARGIGDEVIMRTPRGRTMSLATTRERSLARNRNIFISHVRVIFLGEIPRKRGLVCLVQNFQSSFNRLSTEHQDPDDRQLEGKVRVVKRTIKPISDSITKSGVSHRFEALFKVRARCKGCSSLDSPASLFASPNLTTSLRPPSEEDMRQGLDSAIKQAEDSCKFYLRPVKGVDEVAEMDVVSCGSAETSMTFVVSIGLNADQGTLEDADEEALELSIMETYNAEFSSSDEFFRNVHEVRFIGASGDANKKEVEGLPPKFESDNYLFEVSMTCWGCPDTLTFFKDGGGSGDVFRRLLFSDKLVNSAVNKPSNRFLQHVGNGCYRPVFGTEGSWTSSAPDEIEFKESLQTAIASVQQTTDLLQEVSIVGRLHELDQQPHCSDDIVEFAEEILVEFTGDPGNLSDSTVGALEAAAMYSYNELAFDYCDPNFRYVTAADLVGVETVDDGTRRLTSIRGGGIRRTQGTVFFYTNAFRFKVKLKCRGCKKNKKAFYGSTGNDRVRLLGEESLYKNISRTGAHPLAFVKDDGRRELQESSYFDGCYCPTWSDHLGRPPTAEEYGKAFNLSFQSISNETTLFDDWDIVLSEVVTVDEGNENWPVSSTDVEYSAKVMIQNNYMDNRWLTGGRDPATSDTTLWTQNYLDGGTEQSDIEKYQWRIMSQAFGATKDTPDKNLGDCVTYDGWIILQSYTREQRYIKGCQDDGSGVYTTVFTMSDPWSLYHFQVRSEVGNALLSDIDPKAGQCVKYHEKVYLQNKNMEYRFLAGSLSTGNIETKTLDPLAPSSPSIGAFEFMFRDETDPGDGTLLT